jgi:hypothetical protein
MPNSYGLSSLIIGGVPTFTGYVVQAFTRTYTPGVTTTVEDANGKTVTRRYDDENIEIVVEAIFRGASLPGVGSSFTYDGASYELTNLEVRGVNNDWRRIVLTGLRTEYV